MSDNDLHFDNPAYQGIFDLFKTAIENQQPLPDANLFAMSDNNLLRDTALSLMLSSYSISKRWEDKGIIIPSIETHLRIDLEESILTFKQKKIDQLLEENSYQLHTCQNDDDITILMAERKQLTDLRRAICQQLRRVIA